MKFVTDDGWIKVARRVPGIPDKVYSQANSCQGFAAHSWVGRESEFADGIPNRFLNTDKLANGQYTANAAASCIFINRQIHADNDLIQMYSLTGSTWTTGSRAANTTTIPSEAEGGLVGNEKEPLDAGQKHNVKVMTQACVEWAKFIGQPVQFIPGINMLEHHQWVSKYGGGATACASGRYQQVFNEIANETGLPTLDDPSPEALEALAIALTLNKVLVMQRDIERLQSQPGNAVWKLHSFLRGTEFGKEFEMVQDYQGRDK